MNALKVPSGGKTHRRLLSWDKMKMLCHFSDERSSLAAGEVEDGEDIDLIAECGVEAHPFVAEILLDF